jgi:tripartite-type tricarboxylate transporter receptor subunit TctC
MGTRLKLLAGLAAAALWTAAGAQTTAAPAGPADWGTKPIKIVVGFAPGTAPDIFARLYGEYVAKKLGTSVVIDNRAGAAGNLAADAVAKSPGDGYTLLYNLSTGFTINPYIYSKLPYDAAKDLVPVATTMRQGLVLLARPTLNMRSVKDLVAAAKAKPGSISHASYGAGSPSHLIAEWLKDEATIDMVHVPYRTSPMADLMGGQVDTAMEPMATAFQLIAGGKVTALAYSGAARFPALPDVPTLAETTPGLAMMSWHGIWAPSSTPMPIVNRINALFVEASKDPEVAKRIRDMNSEPLGVSRAEMTSMIARDAEIYGRIVKAKGIKVD